ncbi:carbohydrate esterase family 8 protein [Collybiopsis luxurians FD-317 M1]|uniref:Pectinesterase n=1 Tax=Collybiopsis luxurians FD-317 M1 TaxID=944289 RepID=A0A0D0CWA3_9AGAR|nr:carbohydrate esterase family 8 protein [Collybiopsis luxurians FD-317 M1]
MLFCAFLTCLVSVLQFKKALAAGSSSRTSPPPGAIVVRQGTTNAGEFGTINEALASIPDDTSNQTLFLFPGSYLEQVHITRTGAVTIYGYTTDTSSYVQNEATITFNASATSLGDDASGTLRIRKSNFSMYNVNVKNTFIGSQAVAISQFGNQVGLYGCGFFGFQDTLYANAGAQVYLKGYIEGAVDFIFGSHGLAYFGGNVIGVKGPGYITANGRDSASDPGSYVFNQNTVVLTPDAPANTSGSFYFGRPWVDYAIVIFKNTVLEATPNPALWSLWDGNVSSVDHVLNADFNTTGPGAIDLDRASWAVELDADEAMNYSISSALGMTMGEIESWVDMDYFV